MKRMLFMAMVALLLNGCVGVSYRDVPGGAGHLPPWVTPPSISLCNPFKHVCPR